MNPRDIMTDAIHNFHPQYQQYTQYSSGKAEILKNSILNPLECDFFEFFRYVPILSMLSLFPHWVEFTTPFDFWVCCQFNFVQTIGGSKLQIQIILQLVITDCKLLINLNSTVTECYLKRPKRIWNASIFSF